MKKVLLALAAAILFGCAASPPPKPVEVVMSFQSEIPIEITFSAERDCTGNWNFCQYQ